MKARSHSLSPFVARDIAVMCLAVLVASAPMARAGINVWTSQGPPGGNVYALAIDPSTPQTLYAGTDGSVFKSTDAGATWGSASAGLIGTGVSALAVDPIMPQTLYAGTYGGGVFKSTDAGATWSAANAGLSNRANNYYFAVSALAIDPSTPQTLYAGTSGGGGVFKSTDAAATWSAANAGLTNTNVAGLAIDPSTPQTLYAGTIEDVFKSTDAGATWGAANAGLDNPNGFFALAIDPSTPQTLYAGTYGGGVFKSTDAGATWGAANAGLPTTDAVWALAIDPGTPQTLYAGTLFGDGVFKSTDGGSTWNALNTGLTNTRYTRVQALAIDPMEPHRVYAGTAGGGVFAIEQVPPSCVGDCAGADTVAIDDVVTLVNIALGSAQPSACPDGGLPLGGEVDVAVIIEAVNNALNGCGGGTHRCVAEEPADELALSELAAWADLPTFRTGNYLQITSTDRATMVFPPMPPGNRDYNNYVCRGQEDVVAGGGALDPIYVDSPSCPEAYVKGLVAARVEGSGRLARLWATGLDLALGGPVKEAVFRIYVDDEPEPCIELKIGDAKTPPASLEIFAAPFGANTSNNLAWYYPVVFSKKLIISIDNIPNNLTWYQASFVLDEKPTEHERATERLPARDKAKALLGSVGAPVADAAPLAPDTAVSLPTDTPVTVATLTGPATVHSFRVRVPNATIDALNMIDVAVTWDADTTPAIAMPLGDLFASAAGMADTHPTSSLPLAITKAMGETTLDLRLPMPFATQAVIVLNNHAAAATVDVAIDGLPSLPTEPWGHLVAIRSETLGPTTNAYHPVVTASGEGRLVGVCLMAEGHSSPLLPAFIRGPLNFLEGDEQIKIDGQTFRGTGTEDYFDSAFYFDRAAAGFPFAQWGGKVADVPNDNGKVSACRWHILGAAIDFHQSLDLSIEVGPPDPASLNRYVTTAFLYRPR